MNKRELNYWVAHPRMMATITLLIVLACVTVVFTACATILKIFRVI